MEAMSELIGYEQRTSRIVRSGYGFVARHPFTGEVVAIPEFEWTPEMKKEMQEWLKKLSQAD